MMVAFKQSEKKTPTFFCPQFPIYKSLRIYDILCWVLKGFSEIELRRSLDGGHGSGEYRFIFYCNAVPGSRGVFWRFWKTPLRRITIFLPKNHILSIKQCWQHICNLLHGTTEERHMSIKSQQKRGRRLANIFWLFSKNKNMVFNSEHYCMKYR